MEREPPVRLPELILIEEPSDQIGSLQSDPQMLTQPLVDA
jgi:hypothetical protein